MKQPFEAVVEHHATTVLRVCRSMLAVDDADDAWSETFLAALRAYPDLPEQANVEAWLVTIARRKAIDVHRAAHRDPLPVAELPETPTELGLPGVDDTGFREIVLELPERQRQVVTYRYGAGMSYSEIAAVLGGSVDATRRAAADARKNLRKAPSGVSRQEDEHG
ncbi:MAG: RNA polymerase sigma factor [Actinobacteria bacterium]|nr:RNA polymerase sigma factor [Actinomycetota bacterium]